MPDKQMRKWKLGLLALGVLTLGLAVYVAVQGVSSKQDRATTKQAIAIADKLNNYVNSKQSIPTDLSAAGVKDVPATITYTRKSDSSYEFCVTYKAANTDVSAQVQNDLMRATTNGGYSGTQNPYTGTTDAPTDLYVTSEHKAGKQCQTVKPYLYSYSSGNYGSGTDYNYYTQ
jgi:hypothetical protein